MDPRLLKYYNQELQHIRDVAGEFAEAYPKVAGRLALDAFECADPYVERLLEGFAFLAARVQLKIDAEFPRFTQSLLEVLYPDYLAPTPSMAIVQLSPDPGEGSLAGGFVVPRGTALRATAATGEQTACEYRTAHDVTLWPVELTEVEYFSHAGHLGQLRGQSALLERVRAGVRFRFRAGAGWTFDKLALGRLTLFLRGLEEVPMTAYERLTGNAVSQVVVPVGDAEGWRDVISAQHVRQVGFDDEQALLPYGDRSFQGYRLLHEYFAFPDRFMFVELDGLGPAVRRCRGNELDVLVLLDRSDALLEGALHVEHFALHCTPAINLFPKRADRIHLNERDHEYLIVPDRTRPLDFEVHRVSRVVGHGTTSEEAVDFLPLYAVDDFTSHRDSRAYFTVRRAPRLMSSEQKRRGSRSGHLGSEVYVSLVDTAEAPYKSDLKQLAVETLCTNRDLPLLMTVGGGKTDFTLETGAPVQSVRVLAGPTRPSPAWNEGEATWSLVSHLSLSHLSLVDGQPERNASALRELLALSADLGRATIRKQIDALREVASRGVLRRLPSAGPIVFVRGMEITVTFEETLFGGSGYFLLGAVLDRFFAKYVSINSFTETVVSTVGQGEVVRWPLRTGRRATI